jgi:isoamylase
VAAAEATTAAGSPRVRLGATLLDAGTQFAAWSGAAEAIELCLFDDAGREERLAMTRLDGDRFELAVPGVAALQRYGLRASGRVDRDEGQWCDPTKLLMDPYSRAFVGAVREPRSALAAGSGQDTATLVPHSVVVDDGFDWGLDDRARPHHDWEDTVIYEVHVRGATKRHPSVPPALRGSYAGLASDAFVTHLLELGVTAVELLPIHELVDEGFLADAGLTNYWGYNSVGYFAPAARYGSTEVLGAQVDEFKSMVRALHAAGLEVLLDVVYNHTAEADALGPSLCLRGLDEGAYYRHDDAHRLVDTTGCGNSIDSASPAAVALVVDSLRYWVSTCHVDGFRFDLAPTLARPAGTFDPAAPILAQCAADPVLGGVKLICEPWDVGCEDSFALGRFHAPYREWNGRYRDAVRDFWRGEDDETGAFPLSVTGSSDLFVRPARPSTSSINYVTSHDGFTLRDLVSYEVKHNEANGQDNSDGTDDNRSWNCGVEGETDDPAVRTLRGRQSRAILATLLVSRGVPMLLGGDELGRTQGGNNNAYCQDNETSWLDWEAADPTLHEFVRRALALRRAHRALRAARGAPGIESARWHRTDGSPLDTADLGDGSPRCVALRLTEGADVVVVLFNGGGERVTFVVPGETASTYVEAMSSDDPERLGAPRRGGEEVEVASRSVLVLAVDAAASPPAPGAQPR